MIAITLKSTDNGSGKRPDTGDSSALSRRTRWLFRAFRAYARRYVASHFHVLRLAKDGTPLDFPRCPMIVVMNHPSWWDPMIGLVLTDLLPSWSTHFAPIEERGLAQYRFLSRLGFFGVQVGTRRGSRAFLRQSLAILSEPEAVLWITAQGQFVDPRDRPVRLKHGVGHLAHRLKEGLILPLAIEYPFWNDRCPEALARFGHPIVISRSGEYSPRDWTSRIEAALEETQSCLADAAMRRDPSAFVTIIEGAAGVGGVYDYWRRFRARIRGESFHPEHRVPEYNSP
jgi:1-acyl-sn-glycerol-3-phosphate acyltransferase